MASLSLSLLHELVLPNESRVSDFGKTPLTLGMGVQACVANPEVAGDVAGVLARILRKDRVVEQRNDEDDLRPGQVRQSRPGP